MKLGDHIYNYRKKNKLSMDDFSKRSGISKAYISLLEKGTHPRNNKPIIPSVDTIKKAAAAMNISFEDLFASIDQDISIDDIVEPQYIFNDNGELEVFYNGFVELPSDTQERLLMYFNAIVEAERKKNKDGEDNVDRKD